MAVPALAMELSGIWHLDASEIGWLGGIYFAGYSLAVPVLSAVFGFVSAVGGILLAIAGTLPVSPYITTISFVIYLVCRVVGRRRGRVTRERFA